MANDMVAFTSPLSINKGSVSYTDSYEQIVRGHIVAALTTNRGERVMHPDWGCDILSMLFDPSSELERQDTASYIQDRLIQMVPRAIILGVKVSVGKGEPNVVYIEVIYKSSSYSPASTVAVGLDTSSPSSGAAQ